MESKKERVLAYTLAKVIKDEELVEISGGNGRMDPTSRGTYFFTGGHQGSDVVNDTRFD